MGAEDRGIFAIAVAVSGAVLLVASLGAVNTANVLIPDETQKLNIRRYLGHATRLALLASVVVVPVASLALAQLAGQSSPTLLIAFSAYCCLALLAALYRAGLHGWARHRTAVVGDLLAAAVLLAAATYLMWVDALTVTTLLTWGAIGLGLQAAVAGALVLRCAPRVVDEGMSLNTLARLSLPTLGFTVGGWFATRGDRLVLGAVTDPVEVGVYSTAATLAELPWLVAAGLATIMAPRIAAGESLALVRRYRLAATVGTLGIGIALLPVSWWLLANFLGGAFERGTTSLLILLPAGVLLASSQIDLAACLAVRDTKSGSRVSMLGALLMVLVVPPLAAPLGATGCAIASLFTYGVVAILSRLAWHRNLHRIDARAGSTLENTDFRGSS